MKFNLTKHFFFTLSGPDLNSPTGRFWPVGHMFDTPAVQTVVFNCVIKQPFYPKINNKKIKEIILLEIPLHGSD